MKLNLGLLALLSMAACSSAHAIVLMDATTNNGSFNNPLPTGYTTWDTPNYQTGWTASPHIPTDVNRQWSDAANTPNVLPSGNPVVSGPGEDIPGYFLSFGSQFTSDFIGTVTNDTLYDLSGWAGYAYGVTATERRLALIAINGGTETTLIELIWEGSTGVSLSGAFTQMAGSYTTAVTDDPLAGQNLFVRASLLTRNFASFGDIVVTAVPTPAEENADFDGDSDIDGNDFLIWQRGVGTASPTQMQGNANGDAAVDGADLDIWKTQFGTSLSAAAATNIPEPTGLTLSGLCMTLLAAAARKARNSAVQG